MAGDSEGKARGGRTASSVQIVTFVLGCFMGYIFSDLGQAALGLPHSKSPAAKCVVANGGTLTTALPVAPGEACGKIACMPLACAHQSVRGKEDPA
jgi:hypothetical protein